MKLADVPPSVFLQPQSTTQAAPVNRPRQRDAGERDARQRAARQRAADQRAAGQRARLRRRSRGTCPRSGTSRSSSIPLLRTGRLDRRSSDRHAARDAAAAERDVARLLRARPRPEPRDAQHEPDRPDHARRPRPQPQPARQSCRRARSSSRTCSSRGYGRSASGVALFGTAYCPTVARPRRDQSVMSAATSGSAGERERR